MKIFPIQICLMVIGIILLQINQKDDPHLGSFSMLTLNQYLWLVEKIATWLVENGIQKNDFDETRNQNHFTSQRKYDQCWSPKLRNISNWFSTYAQTLISHWSTHLRSLLNWMWASSWNLSFETQFLLQKIKKIFSINIFKEFIRSSDCKKRLQFIQT